MKTEQSNSLASPPCSHAEIYLQVSERERESDFSGGQVSGGEKFHFVMLYERGQQPGRTLESIVKPSTTVGA